MFLSGVRHCRKFSDGHRHSQKERMSRGQKRKKSTFLNLKQKLKSPQSPENIKLIDSSLHM